MKLNEPYELRVDVRGTLVNVYVNDKLFMAYTLRKARQPGKFAIWTYDATAEFTGVRVEALAADVKLAEQVDGPPTMIPSLDPKTRLIEAATKLRLANETVAIERLKLNIARAERAALDAKIAADDAKYASPPKPDAEKLALAAGVAERTRCLCKAELNALTAQHAMLAVQLKFNTADAGTVKALTDAGLKVVEQGTALAAARAALDKPSPHYTPHHDALPHHQHRPADGAGEVDHEPRQPAGGARRGESHLDAPLRRADRARPSSTSASTAAARRTSRCSTGSRSNLSSEPSTS